jgi:hypothetical protein
MPQSRSHQEKWPRFYAVYSRARVSRQALKLLKKPKAEKFRLSLFSCSIEQRAQIVALSTVEREQTATFAPIKSPAKMARW